MSTSEDSLDHWVKYLDGEIGALNALNVEQVSRRPTANAGQAQRLTEAAKNAHKRQWAKFN